MIRGRTSFFDLALFGAGVVNVVAALHPLDAGAAWGIGINAALMLWCATDFALIRSSPVET